MMPNELQIVDLPKGVESWVYLPTRPTTYVVRRNDMVAAIRCTLQEPLNLKIGDVVLYGGGLPPEFHILVHETSNHKPYAVITIREGNDGKSGSGPGTNVEFVK